MVSVRQWGLQGTRGTVEPMSRVSLGLPALLTNDSPSRGLIRQPPLRMSERRSGPVRLLSAAVTRRSYGFLSKVEMRRKARHPGRRYAAPGAVDPRRCWNTRARLVVVDGAAGERKGAVVVNAAGHAYDVAAVLLAVTWFPLTIVRVTVAEG